LKVGLYNEPGSDNDLGGSEYSIAVLANAFQQDHQVEILHHKASLNRETLEQFCGFDLGKVGLRCVDRDNRPFGRSQRAWQRRRETLEWQSQLSEPNDVFLCFTHFMPPYCHSPRGVLVVLFPYFDKNLEWPWARNSDPGSRLRSALRSTYYNWDWKKRMATYQTKLANSEYTASWTKRRWEIDCRVIYPPVETGFAASEKSNIILNVGRFVGKGRSKNQLELLGAFRELRAARERTWKFLSVGGLTDSPADRAYYEQVVALASGVSAELRSNLGRDQVVRCFEQAKIYWHASGLGEDEAAHPENAEHFGIAPVEAMAAGCVPLVLNRGGLPEIVQHGVNGFRWNTLTELKEFTQTLIADDSLWKQMSLAARARAKVFSQERFVAEFRQALGWS